MTTFSELGIPFPLFKADISDTDDYIGIDNCGFCSRENCHCFKLSIGAGVIVKCVRCCAENGLDADGRRDSSCVQCGSAVLFPKEIDQPIYICYSCLRSGKAALTKDTELGMISWEQAFSGITHGIPGLDRPEYEMVKLEDDWVGVRLPVDFMWELLRTPTYNTIQGDNWKFCCGGPMAFLGSWGKDTFIEKFGINNGKGKFFEIVEDAVEGLWEDELHDVTGIYVFGCNKCEGMRAHWDIA